MHSLPDAPMHLPVFRVGFEFFGGEFGNDAVLIDV